MAKRRKKAGNAKLKDAVLQACIAISERNKVIKESVKKQFSEFAWGDMYKNEFRIKVDQFKEEYEIVSRSEYLMLVNLIMTDRLFCASPLEDISIARWYSCVIKKITIKLWFKHLLTEVYHIHLMPGGITQYLLSQIPDIIPKEWLEE